MSEPEMPPAPTWSGVSVHPKAVIRSARFAQAEAFWCEGSKVQQIAAYCDILITVAEMADDLVPLPAEGSACTPAAGSRPQADADGETARTNLVAVLTPYLRDAAKWRKREADVDDRQSAYYKP